MNHKHLRIAMLCAMYVAQGIPWGFMSTTLPAYLTQHGLDMGFVTATLSFTTLPYTFKWVWGPIIDRFTFPRFGRRRPWIIFAQAMMAVTVIAMIAIPDLRIDIRLLAWMILIHTAFNALQDVAVDALAVDILGDNERGWANGLMYGSKYAGGAIGGVVMANVIKSQGLATALVLQTAILLAIMLLPIFLREAAAKLDEKVSTRELGRTLAQAFSLRSALVCALAILGMNFATGVISATGYALFVRELKWDYARYTGITGGWGLLVGCTFAFAGGFLADKLGRKRLAAGASLLLAAGWLYFATHRSQWGDDDLIYSLAFWEAACSATLSVAMIALCMDLSFTKIGGSQFAAYMALSNFSTTLGYQFAARANELWDFRGVYYFAVGAQVAITLLLIPIDPGQTRREMPPPPGKPINWLGVAGLLVLLAFLIGMTVYVTAQRLGYI